eukprot:14341861-Ditylum_brightwellii.AAC.1
MGREKRELSEMRERQDAAGPVRCHKLERTKNTGAWLTVVPDRLNGTELSAEEIRDNLRLRYGLVPGRLPSK